MNKCGMDIDEFVECLEDTLMPDLDASGNQCTSDDFFMAVKFIKELQRRLAELEG